MKDQFDVGVKTIMGAAVFIGLWIMALGIIVIIEAKKNEDDLGGKNNTIDDNLMIFAGVSIGVAAMPVAEVIAIAAMTSSDTKNKYSSAAAQVGLKFILGMGVVLSGWLIGLASAVIYEANKNKSNKEKETPAPSTTSDTNLVIFGGVSVAAGVAAFILALVVYYKQVYKKGGSGGGSS